MDPKKVEATFALWTLAYLCIPAYVLTLFKCLHIIYRSVDKKVMNINTNV